MDSNDWKMMDRGRSGGLFLVLMVVVCLSTGCKLLMPATFSGTSLPSASRLQNLLDESIVDIGVPGAVMAVVTPSGEKWMGAGGYARIPKDYSIESDGPVSDHAQNDDRFEPMSADMKFRVASIQKSLMATVTLQLAQEGVLRLEDSIESWLPGVWPDGQKITIRQLLNHTSGIWNYSDCPLFYQDVLKYPYKKWKPEQLLDYAKDYCSRWDNGGTWLYSNTNYILIGMIIEKATGKTYGELMRERIINPLKLKNTYVPENPILSGHYCHGYRYNFLGNKDEWTDVTNLVDPSFMGAAGSLVSTAGDLLVWLDALLASTLLSPHYGNEMFQTVSIDETGQKAGLGVEIRNKAIGHAGDFVFGYQSWMFGYKGYRTVILTNGIPSKEGIPHGPKKIFEKLAKLLD